MASKAGGWRDACLFSSISTHGRRGMTLA